MFLDSHLEILKIIPMKSSLTSQLKVYEDKLISLAYMLFATIPGISAMLLYICFPRTVIKVAIPHCPDQAFN